MSVWENQARGQSCCEYRSKVTYSEATSYGVKMYQPWASDLSQNLKVGLTLEKSMIIYHIKWLKEEKCMITTKGLILKSRNYVL